MSEENQNLPDDFWRKAFDEAAETPPARVWDAVERRLDESNGSRLLPLWGMGLASSRPVTWGLGVAAALALLLVGWWAVEISPSDNSLTRLPKPTQPDRVAAAPTVTASPPQNGPANTAPRDAKIAAKVVKPLETVREGLNEAVAVKPPVLIRSRSAESSLARVEPKLALKYEETTNPSGATRLAASPTMQYAPSAALLPDEQAKPTVFVSAPIVAVTTPDPEQATQLALSTLAARPIRLRELGQIQRIVWVRPAELMVGTNAPEVAHAKKESKQFWASASLMPGAFTPLVSIRSVPLPALVSNVAALNANTGSQPSVENRASLSVAYQAGAGVQLTERWSVESGLGYLVGRSVVISPTLATVTIKQANAVSQNETAGNLYADALRNSVSNAKTFTNQNQATYTNMSADNAFPFLARGNYSGQARQTLTNDYRYVQVPVQVSYQLRPRKRLGLALLGGMLTNIFVRNSVGDDLVITSRDGVYRPVSWAATMGARFRYRPSRRWSASLAGIYQPSLGLGTRATSEVVSRPTSTGMSFGVDYHF